MILTCGELEENWAMDEEQSTISGAQSGTAPSMALRACAASEISPEQLAAHARAGCRESFEALVTRYERQIFNFIHQFTRQRQDAEDLTQETFLKAYRGLSQYNPSRAFAPWLFTIARRTAINHFRSAKRFEELPEESEDNCESPASQLENADERESIWKRARTLKPKQFEVLWLRYHEGFSVAETAAIMRTNQLHVKVLLHRARANFARLLPALGPKSSDSKKVRGVP